MFTPELLSEYQLSDLCCSTVINCLLCHTLNVLNKCLQTNQAAIITCLAVNDAEQEAGVEQPCHVTAGDWAGVDCAFVV